jgi:nucleoid-associated protein YgaU
MLIFGLWSEDIKTFIEPPGRQLRKPAVARKATVPKAKPAKKVQVPVEQEAKQPPEIVKPVAPSEEQVAVVTPPEPISEPRGETLPVPEKAAPKQPEPEVAMVDMAKEPAPGEIPAEQKLLPPASITFVAPEPIPAEAAIEEVEPAVTVAPVIKENRLVKSGDTFLVMIQQVYGEGHLKPHFISQVIEANPHLADPHNLSISDEIFFPELIPEPEIPSPLVEVAAKGGSLVSKKLQRKLDPVDSPELIGSLTVMPGDTLGKLIRGIYGPFSFNPEYTKKVLTVNPQLKNPDSLEVGETVFFPDLPVTPEIGLPAKPGAVASRGELPEFLGEIITIEEETFGDMIRRLYGPNSLNQENLNKVLAVNPQIDDPAFISVGQKLRFPTILIALTERAPEVWWVKLVTLGDLQNAYRFLRVYSEWAPPMLIIPSRSEAGKIRYNIVLQEYYVDQATAEAKISSLPASVTADAKPIHGLDSKTYYYWTKQGG